MGQALPRANSNYQFISTPGDQVKVEVATTKKEKEKIYRLRYQIYVENMGRRLSNADHKHQMVYDDMDDWGILFYARVGKEIAGTLRLHIGYKDEFSPELIQPLSMDKFQDFRPNNGLPHRLSFASKGMVDPRYRNSQIFNALFSTLYETCRQQSVLYNFLGCALYLVSLYERLGFRRYKGNFFVPDYGCMVPLVNVLEDVDHLHLVHSPFRHVAEKRPNLPESAEWFAREFPTSRYINKQLTSEAEHWRILSEKLDKRPEKAIGLFSGLSETEARLCAPAGHLVFCEQEETIVYPEDISNEIFIVISGSLEVRKELANRRQTPAILQPGQAFGEKTFLTHARQKATVTAQTDTELLIIPRHSLDRLQRQQPEVAAKLLYNIGARVTRKYA